ncbi:uncharacterized protein Z518_02252 [Rhinocladiella mackenziei CBS 650.93]|uniref:HAD-like protein n=1 Tax=Rhinocladiella mackenziei CBS 650.93 TaxID=1442369 RepID=A0A0D2IP36_9EURO|nr:uncharacterized protein Z518_02252 [Rhinocladiella mackenziei CBS 650.93]KIX07599.1 hypothetical protein Z518_02252 [Rhinocladiella mackenziei CBS 650.93]
MADTHCDCSEPRPLARVDSKLDLNDVVGAPESTEGTGEDGKPVSSPQCQAGPVQDATENIQPETNGVHTPNSKQDDHDTCLSALPVQNNDLISEGKELQTSIDSTRESPVEKAPETNGITTSFDKQEVNGEVQAATETNKQPKRISKIPAIIVDIGGVLANWTALQSLAIAPAMLHRFRKTRFWYEYDLGLLSQDECYGRLAAQYGVSASDIAEAFDKARESLVPNDAVFDMIRELKTTYHDSLRIYLMSNIPSAEWKCLQENPRFEWTLFDGFFTSSQTGMCKPELRFFRHVLQSIGLKPADVVLVDDNAENVLAARSLGIQSWRFRGADGLKQFFKILFHDPIERGWEYLHKNAKEMWSVTPQGREVRDNFAQLFLYEAVDDLNLVTMTFYERTWNYYIEKQIDTVEKHPDDIDTTSLAMILLPNDVEKANSILDEVLGYTTEDGIIMTYFDNKRPRVDPAVCVNALRFFYKYSRGDSPALQPTKNWVSDVLFYRAYLDGTYYYPTGDVFLYLFSRLLTANPHSDIYRSTASLLRERLQERIGTTGDALELAMRVIACHDMGIKNDVDLRKLEISQEEDGGWEVGWLCQTGKTSLKIGNRGLTTALAVKAIDMVRKTK